MSAHFFHSADWQIGARFRQFGERAEFLRQARLETLARTLTLAASSGAEFLLVAGDLFEDDQVGQSTVDAVMACFRAAAPLRILLLPGNHDPLTGPGCVWNRPPFADPPAHVVVLRSTDPLELAGGGFLLPSPLSQKASTLDPCAAIGRAAAVLPPNAIRIGITHGSLAIEGRHQPDDFPVALDAASRHGLDYLAIGHWHSWFPADGGRILMPGTPEPTNFDERESGFVAEVTITSRASPPAIRQVRTAGLTWEVRHLDLESPVTALTSVLTTGITKAEKTLLRVILSGTIPAATAAQVTADLGAHEAEFAALQIEDRTVPDLQSSELAALLHEHPTVASVVADLAHASAQCGGETLTGTSDLDRAELADLFAESALPPTATDADRLDVLREAGRLLGATLPETVREN